jgi:hypothetical protein
MMVLENAGFVVFSALTVSKLETTLLNRHIKLLVLCHSLSSASCAATLELVESKYPCIRTLALTAGTSALDRAENHAVLCAFDGPRKLVLTVKRMLLENYV